MQAHLAGLGPSRVTLGDFLKACSGKREPWNCSTLPADWCIALGHPDYAAEWRGISDSRECEDVAAVGLVTLWDRGIGGALPTVEPEALATGDIAVVALGSLQAGAIWTGERFAIRIPSGLHFSGGLHVLKAWRP